MSSTFPRITWCAGLRRWGVEDGCCEGDARGSNGVSKGSRRATRGMVVGRARRARRLLGSAKIARNPSKYGVKCVLGVNEEVGVENKSKSTPLTFRPDFWYNMK